MKSTAHRYADSLLPVPLVDYVAEKRAEGKSWRRISLDLRDDTDGEIDVTHETLRTWCAEAEAVTS